MVRSEARLFLHTMWDKRRESQNQEKLFLFAHFNGDQGLFISRRGGTDRT